VLRLFRYRRANNARAILELAATTIPLFLLWVIMAKWASASGWFGAVLWIPAVGLLVRLFMVQA
jgi:omega-6 fatty acid desaturase (delta-12 desaturase)